MTDLERCQAALRANGFDVWMVRYPEQAKQTLFDEILPTVKAGPISMVLIDGEMGL